MLHVYIFKIRSEHAWKKSCPQSGQKQTEGQGKTNIEYIFTFDF